MLINGNGNGGNWRYFIASEEEWSRRENKVSASVKVLMSTNMEGADWYKSTHTCESDDVPAVYNIDGIAD